MATHRKKLIEVALPLPEINDASAFDKRPGIGPHPKAIHHWWARLPLPAARAVLFASVVDDPSSQPERFPSSEAQVAERERLFDMLRRMMQKRLHDHPEVYAALRAEMLKHSAGQLPPVLDPFAGGGSIPLEAARMGFAAHAADLNPVGVLLNMCNLELVPRWLGRSPINPESRKKMLDNHAWSAARGVAEDVRYYGRLVRQRAIAKIGRLYPRVRLPKGYGNQEVDVIAWLWARTVASPNPAAKAAHVPLVSTFCLSSRKGSFAWLKPVINRQTNTWRFEVCTGDPPDRKAVKHGTKLGRGCKFKCILTDEPIPDAHVKVESVAGRLGYRLLAIVGDTTRGRIYCSPTPDHEEIASTDLGFSAETIPELPLAIDKRNIWCSIYGLDRFDKLFTRRQLTTVATLSDLVKAVRADALEDGRAAGLSGTAAADYSKTIVTLLALALDRCAESGNALCRWDSSPAGQRIKGVFGRQAIPMVWDFAEANILGEKSVCWQSAVDIVCQGIEAFVANDSEQGHARQIDAAGSWDELRGVLVSTDPPYYDNIGYAALSDFFYVWLRRTIGDLYPDLFEAVS